jgi:hypothetical protein
MKSSTKRRVIYIQATGDHEETGSLFSLSGQDQLTIFLKTALYIHRVANRTSQVL